MYCTVVCDGGYTSQEDLAPAIGDRRVIVVSSFKGDRYSKWDNVVFSNSP